MKWTIQKPEQWADVAQTVAKYLQKPLLLLQGDMGVGKTTFTSYLLKKLGSRDSVSSPTYALVNEYQGINGKIYHFDLYRIKEEIELYDIGLEEYLENGILSIIEWPDHFMNIFEGKAYHSLKIMETPEGTREVEFN